MGVNGSVWLRIDTILESRGMSLMELIEKAGLNYKTTKSQRCRSDLNKLDDAIAISRVLGISLDFLATGREAESFSKEAIAVEYDDNLKAVVRACQANPHLLDVIATTVVGMEELSKNA